MFKRSTRMDHKQCLCLLTLVLLIFILVFCIQSVEGFEDSVPAYCGSAGYTPSKAWSILSKSKPEDEGRGYTKSECDKIDGATFTNGSGYCNIIKDGKTIFCTDTCKGLNKIPTLPPNECKIDGKLAGITNKEFKLDDMTFPENTVRLYTQKECESLNGKHNISFLAQMNETNRNDFITKHGKGYGFCGGQGLDTLYSFICYAEPPSATDIKNKIAGMFS